MRLNSNQTVSMDKQCCIFDEDAKLLVYCAFKCVMVLNFTDHITLKLGPEAQVSLYRLPNYISPLMNVCMLNSETYY